MLVTGVDVSLDADGHEAVKVVDVHVDKDAEESSQDLFTDGDEVLGERDVRLRGEDLLRVDLPLDPVHEVGHVLHGGQDSRLLELVPISPQVLVLWSPGHAGTSFLCAVLCDRAVDQVDSVEEVHDMDGDPVVQVLVRRKFDGVPQVQS